MVEESQSQVTELTPEELVDAVETGREIAVLDVRAPQRLESGRIDILPDARFFNIRGSELLSYEDARDAGLDPATPLAVVCGLGSDSKRIARHLAEQGFDASSITGGMTAWMRASVLRELRTPPDLDRFIQFDRIGKGALGYVLISDGEALVVDPPRNTAPFVEAIESAGAKIVAVADTHAHADYISGGPGLAAQHEVPYYLHPSDAVYPYDGTPGKVHYEAVRNATRIGVGRADIVVAHTPGHTEGSVSYRLGDDLVLTGDFVFIHSVGRPDLGGKTEEWTHVLWDSLCAAKEGWPGKIEIYPAHYATAAERRADNSVGATFETVCRNNPPLAIADAGEFLAWVMARAGAFPAVYRRIKAINVGLETVDDVEADELEAGKNECALG